MKDSQDIPARRWRLRITATLALVVAVVGVVAVVLATQSPSPANGSSSRNQTSGSATVQRRDLVQTDTESGTLSFASPQTVYNRLSGTITWLPAVGQVIKPGQALYKAGNEPAILMNGTTPAYRDLNSSDTAGPDVLELNRNLVRLGFNAGAIVQDDEWQAATTEGVDRDRRPDAGAGRVPAGRPDHLDRRGHGRLGRRDLRGLSPGRRRLGRRVRRSDHADQSEYGHDAVVEHDTTVVGHDG